MCFGKGSSYLLSCSCPRYSSYKVELELGSRSWLTYQRQLLFLWNLVYYLEWLFLLLLYAFRTIYRYSKWFYIYFHNFHQLNCCFAGESPPKSCPSYFNFFFFTSTICSLPWILEPVFHDVNVAEAVDCLVGCGVWELVRMWKFLGLRKELAWPSVGKGSWEQILFSFVVSGCNSGWWLSTWSSYYIHFSLLGILI